MIKGFVVGTVKFPPKMVEIAGKSKFLSILVESTNSYNGKDYHQSVDVAVYGKAIDDASKIPLGALVVAQGDMSCRTREYQGKTYANLRMNGEVRLLVQPPSMQSKAADKPDSDEGDPVPF